MRHRRVLSRYSLPQWAGEKQIDFMTDALRHRGPDDRGTWVDTANGIALGHCRLSVIDASGGRQPMRSACGRYVMVYNGEVYNHPDIKKDLEKAGHEFQSRSDTEVVLHAVAHWGIEEALRRFDGMFAFAVWDRRSRVLCLARDKIGMKPLYYGRQGHTLLFASELKGIRACNDFHARLNPEALDLFLRYQYVPGPLSIYREVQKLPPGCYARIEPHKEPVLVKYWDLLRIVEEGTSNPSRRDEEAAAEELRALLRGCVTAHMISDVPLGVFLSGGIDSSLIAAVVQEASPRRIKTFTIGFEEPQHDESTCARRVAEYIGADHTEFRLDHREALSVIGDLTELYDEPFADSAQIPVSLLARMAKQSVTVALSGDGGDELFFGYRHYVLLDRLTRVFRFLPSKGRLLFADFAKAMQREKQDVSARLPFGGPRVTHLRHKLRRLAEFSRIYSEESFYSAYLSNVLTDEPLVLEKSAPESPLQIWWERGCDLDLISRMSFTDFMTSLPECFLAKTDRASMGVGLEVRLPLLADSIVRWAWRLPRNMKVRDGGGKWLLRQVLCQYLPEGLTNRPKKGLSVPLDEWLRGPLRSWAEGLLHRQKIQREGILATEYVARLWDEHTDGKRNWGRSLWCVLMFQAWKERWL